MARASFCTLSALRAKCVVDDGKIVYHRDCAGRANLSALRTSDTAYGTYVHNCLALCVRGASNVNFCVCRNAIKQLLRACVDTSAAGGATVGIDGCAAFGKADCIFGAYACAVSVAQAAVLASLCAAVELSLFFAVLSADVFKLVLCLLAACASAYADGGGCIFVRDAQYVCDHFFLISARNVAFRKICFTLAELCSKAGATGATATAAVCACQIFKDFFYLFICVDLAYFCNDQNENGQKERDTCKDTDNEPNLTPLNFL